MNTLYESAAFLAVSITLDDINSNALVTKYYAFVVVYNDAIVKVSLQGLS